MKAARVEKPREGFRIVELDTPQPGPGQVRIAVEACGICRSDLLVSNGYMPGIEYPRIPGHEVAGRIDAVGEGVELWKVGDRVGVGWHGGHCFHCDRCRRGDFINCAHAKITGISHDGGYADMMISPWEACARIPDDLDAADAGPLLCAGITTYNALRNSGVASGATVAVQGIGGLGHLAIQFARQMGFHVVAISGSDAKRELAAELGAHDFVDQSRQDPAAALQKLGGADLVLATAPDSELIGAVLGGLTPRGQLLIVAGASKPMTLKPVHLLSGRRIQGWPSGTPIDCEDRLRFGARHGVRPRIERFPLERVAEAFERVFSNKVRFRAVLEMT